jgi:formamidopyrimidine-DNA glycosylase
MPELPEVEFARRSLERWLAGERVVRAQADPTRIFRGADRKRFTSLRGRLVQARRKGKYLLLAFEGGQGLLSHLGMTGKWVRRPPSVREPYSRARLFLEGGEVVHYRDPRMFGRLEPTAADGLDALPVVQALGVDPLVDGLTARTLAAAIGPSRQALKVALLDQGRVAGLGNIHAAEALYRAHLHPSREPQSLTPAEWRALRNGILATFRLALKDADLGERDEIEYVEEGGRNPFLVYGRAGEPCRRCRTPLQSFTQAGRTTHFCPGCQG